MVLSGSYLDVSGGTHECELCTDIQTANTIGMDECDKGVSRYVVADGSDDAGKDCIL